MGALSLDLTRRELIGSSRFPIMDPVASSSNALSMSSPAPDPQDMIEDDEDGDDEVMSLLVPSATQQDGNAQPDGSAPIPNAKTKISLRRLASCMGPASSGICKTTYLLKSSLWLPTVNRLVFFLFFVWLKLTCPRRELSKNISVMPSRSSCRSRSMLLIK